MIKITDKVLKLLEDYSSSNVGVRSNIARILMTGSLAGTGKMVILPVDQGFEHGPERTFQKNPPAYDPNYHVNLAINSGLNAYAAPLGSLEVCADKFLGSMPLILKLNSSNSLFASSCSPSQAITASVKDAIRLGCSAVGMTIYPGSNGFNDSIKEIKEIIREASEYGIASVVWSYPRGEGISKKGETAIDIVSYAAHIAALIGAHIIKVKPPTDHIEQEEAKKAMSDVDVSTLDKRIAIVKRACLNGRRLVVFSGGATKSDEEMLTEVREIHLGGGDGSIIGRNAFQRPLGEAQNLLSKITAVYQS